MAKWTEEKVAHMVSERKLLKTHVRELKSELERLYKMEKGEYICKKCSLRKDSEHDHKADF